MTKMVLILLAAMTALSAQRSRAQDAGVPMHFEKTKAILGKYKIEVELADTEEKRERGLMNRTALKDTEGMLFIFPAEQHLSFWMKDTLIPLSIGYFTESGKLFQILEMEPASPIDRTPPVYDSSKDGKYALEMPKGWFKRKNIEVGAQLKVPKIHLPDR